MSKQPEVHIAYGQGIARKVFAKRGNHTEAHLSEVEVAAIGAVGYLDGMRDSGRDELLAALKQLLAEVEEMTRRSGWAGNGGRAMASAAIAKVEGQS